MPPLVAARRPGDILASAREDKDVLNERAFLERRVDDCLGSDGLAAALAFVSRDDDTAPTVQHAIAERLCGETSKNDGVNCTNASACEERCDGLPSHWQVDRNSVTLLDAK